MSEGKRRLVTVPMEVKLDALKRLEKGENINKIARELNVGRSTVFDWKYNKSKIELWCSQQIATDSVRMRKRMKRSVYEKVNEALYQWYLMRRDNGAQNVSGPILQEKALKFYEDLKEEGQSGFSASNGWLDKWKQRYGVKQASIGSEKLFLEPSILIGVDSESIEEKLKQQSLRNIELNYPPVDTWNLTEDSIPTENQPTVSTSKSASTSISSQQKNTTKKSTKDKRGNPRTVVSTDLQTTDANTEDTFQLLEKIRLLEERNIQLHIENESYRVQNIMLETQKKKLIGRLRTIIKDKDPLEGLGEHTLVYEQQSQRLTLGPSSSSPVVPVALVASSSRSGSGDQGRIAGTSSTTTYQPQDQEFLDPDDPADDNAFLDNLDSGEIEIDVDHDGGLESDFEVLDIKPNILIEEETPPSPKRKRNIDATMPKLTNDSNNVPLMETNAKCSKGELKKKRLLCDFGDDDNEDDDNSQQDSDGDEFNSEDDSTKVRRAYQLLKSVFEKKDSYDLFCERLAGRLRALQSKKVCRHVQQMLVTVIEDAESGKYDNV